MGEEELITAQYKLNIHCKACARSVEEIFYQHEGYILVFTVNLKTFIAPFCLTFTIVDLNVQLTHIIIP